VSLRESFGICQPGLVWTWEWYRCIRTCLMVIPCECERYLSTLRPGCTDPITITIPYCCAHSRPQIGKNKAPNIDPKALSPRGLPMERNARAGTPYELTPDSRLSKAPAKSRRAPHDDENNDAKSYSCTVSRSSSSADFLQLGSVRRSNSNKTARLPQSVVPVIHSARGTFFQRCTSPATLAAPATAGMFGADGAAAGVSLFLR
jgi:hypothetical protein